MGQIVRMNQAERFEQQFGEIELGMVSLKPGDKLTFVRPFLGRLEGSSEEVILGYEFKAEDGISVNLYEDRPLFVPDDNGSVLTADDAVESGLHEHYGLSEEEFRRRWKIVLNED